MSSNGDISKGAVGWITFAGFMMVIGGGFAMLEGLGMLIHKANFPGVDAVLQQHSSTWGWFHLIVGAALLFSGIGIFSGNVLARTVGVIAATISALNTVMMMTARILPRIERLAQANIREAPSELRARRIAGANSAEWCAGGPTPGKSRNAPVRPRGEN